MKLIISLFDLYILIWLYHDYASMQKNVECSDVVSTSYSILGNGKLMGQASLGTMKST